jgi:hypothetical protein
MIFITSRALRQGVFAKIMRDKALKTNWIDDDHCRGRRLVVHQLGHLVYLAADSMALRT